jgi:hypothetical protein
MNEKTLLASGSPITQRIDAVKALLAWKKVSSDPLPQEVSLIVVAWWLVAKRRIAFM